MVSWQLLQSKCLIWHGEKKNACLSLALLHHRSSGNICTWIAAGSTWMRGMCAQDAMHPTKPLPHTHHWHEVFGNNVQGAQQKCTWKPIGSLVLLVAFPKYHALSEQSKVCGYWRWDSLRMATTLQKIQWSVRSLFCNKRVLSKKERGRSWKHSFVPLRFE